MDRCAFGTTLIKSSRYWLLCWVSMWVTHNNKNKLQDIYYPLMYQRVLMSERTGANEWNRCSVVEIKREVSMIIITMSKLLYPVLCYYESHGPIAWPRGGSRWIYVYSKAAFQGTTRCSFRVPSSRCMKTD